MKTFYIWLLSYHGKKVRTTVAKVKFKNSVKKNFSQQHYCKHACFSFVLIYAQPGRLSDCQGMGWYLEEANLAQVSLNLLDYHKAGMHAAYEECVKDAKVLLLFLLTCPLMFHDMIVRRVNS